MLDQWYGVIPNIVLFDKELTDKQKLLFCLISSLCAEKWFCRATNEYIWDLLNADKRTISRNLTILQWKWFITIEVETRNKRKITIDKQGSRIDTDVYQDRHECLSEDRHECLHNNISNNITIEYIYEKYYWATKWINGKKCMKLINDILKQWSTLNDIYVSMVLYNNECRSSIEWKFVKKLETWLTEYQLLTDEQIEDRLTRIIAQHKQRKKTDEKYGKSKPCKDLWNELCETFWKDKVNTIFKNEWWSTTTINFT